MLAEHRTVRRPTLFAVAIAFLVPAPVRAQHAGGEHRPEGGVDSACSYAACALTIIPRWNGLAVIRGTHGPRVANLNFFWPHSVAWALRDGASDSAADSATARAERALGLRRAGAALTDAGLIATAIVGAHAASRGRMAREDRIVAGAGLAALVISVPLQFAADGELSRAVWWHNLRFLH